MGETEGLPEDMAEIKRTMEQDCEKLRIHLEQLMNERAAVTEEFKHLYELQHRLLIQLKSDTLAGEGQLHTFQVEKRRVEDRLDQLEQQLEEKNRIIVELDAKASEYLLKVTTASNSIYDDDGNSEENEENRILIKQLVYNDMIEHDDFSDTPEEDKSASCEHSEETADASDEDSRPATPSISDGDSKLKSLSHESETSEMCDDTSYSFDKSNILDQPPCEEIPYDLPPPTGGPTSPAHLQILSISNLLDELRGVKEEMGRFVSLKDSSMVELELELQDTKSELTVLKDSINTLVKDLNPGEESRLTVKRDSSIKRSLPDISELHEIKEICSVIQEEKKDLVYKMGSLKDIMHEMRRDQSRSLDRRGHSHSVELNLNSYVNNAARRSSSTCSVSGKVALLERELSEATDKLNESALHMNLLVKEREHKQRECELLQRKVTKVEAKMHELQVTFDTLMSAIMAERDELVKELKEKEDALVAAKKEDDPHQESSCAATLEALAQVDAMKSELEITRADCNGKIESLEAANALVAKERANLKQLQEEWHQREASMYTTLQMEEVKTTLSEKETMVKDLQERISNFEIERTDFASALQGEMERLKEEAAKAKEDKQSVETVFSSLQSEQEDLQEKHNKLLERFNYLTKENSGNSTSLESMKKETVTLESKLSEMSAKNQTMNSEMQTKEGELKEELSAREATIQELRITLTNNQKQSRENYQMLQDDMAVLQLRLSKEREEYDAVVAHLKDKCTKLEEDCQQMQQDRDSLKNKLEEADRKALEYDQTQNDNEEIDKKNDLLQEMCENEAGTEEKQARATENSSDADKEDGGESASKSFSDEEEFRKVISDKESKIVELESRVEQLESAIKEKNTFVSELEDKLKDYNREAEETGKTSKCPETENRMDAQLREIEKLNNNLDELKNDLEASAREKTNLQDTVEQLLEEKKNVEIEKDSLIRDYEGKLSQLQDIADHSESDAVVKKNLVEGLEFKLSTIESRVLDDRPCVVSSLLDRLSIIESFYESKLKESNSHFQSTVNNLRLDLQALRSENESCKSKMSATDQTIDSLRDENASLSTENKKIISDNAEKQDKYIEMQNQMVSDLEGLILGLEKDKKNLEIEIDSLKKDLSSVEEERKKILGALEASLTRIREEKRALQKDQFFTLTQGYSEEPPREVESLLEKMNEVTYQLDAKEKEFEEKLKINGEAHSAEVKQLRQDMTEEIDILDQQKEEMRTEFEKQIARLASECASKAMESERDHVLHFSDEKTQFGRVLVAKNDEYEKLKEENQVETDGYQARIHDLQLQLEEKANLVEELEVNIEELIVVRSNLEEKLDVLKTPKSERGSHSPSNSAGRSPVPVPLFATNVKPPMQN